MGRIVTAKCTNCDYHKDLLIGGGLSDCDPETAMNVLPERARQQFVRAFEQGAARFGIDRRLAVCDFCGEIFALPVVDYTWNGNQSVLYGVCPSCGRDGGMSRKIPEAELIQRACPKCGAGVELQHGGNWD